MNLKRAIEMKAINKLLFRKAQRIKSKRESFRFVENLKAKKILMMHASPFIKKMLKQRPHHFLVFFAKHFDIVLFWSFISDEPEHLKDNIYLIPHTPIGKFSDKEFYYYMSSVSCNKYSEIVKMKKYGYKIIYDYYDEISDDIAKSKNARKFHKNMAKINPDIVIATSDKLYNDVKDQNALLIKNGVTIEDFIKKTDEIPFELKKINKPIVGYYGLLAPWIDLELIEKCLIKRPQYNFIFIGKILDSTNIDNLMKYPNFHYLGLKDYFELYKYSTNFNCAIIPFRLGGIAKATSPNKLFEYMAAGVPVVCTRDLVECEGYEGVFMSKDDESFIENIDKALKLDLRDKLISQAKENSWENKANEILEHIKRI